MVTTCQWQTAASMISVADVPLQATGGGSNRAYVACALPALCWQVNKVQLDIRQGHAQTVEKVLKWVDEEGGVQGITVADCGCGTGEATCRQSRPRPSSCCCCAGSGLPSCPSASAATVCSHLSMMAVPNL
jgi:hypothetical protein